LKISNIKKKILIPLAKTLFQPGFIHRFQGFDRNLLWGTMTELPTKGNLHPWLMLTSEIDVWF
jgi:hypothetical protein